ncbi:MAG TPA: hypothetical protein VG889_15320 [Rhizomicrobium sp.]|nr:hypothetical protein [Rhizomicrobium sp.]
MGRKELAKSGFDTAAETKERQAVVVLSPGKRGTGGNLSDLPDELLKELRLGPRTSLDAQILDVFRALGGTATLDDVLIGLYRMFAVVQKRRFVQNAIWRMIRKGHLTAQKGKRGSFALASVPQGRRKGRS